MTALVRGVRQTFSLGNRVGAAEPSAVPAPDSVASEPSAATPADAANRRQLANQLRSLLWEYYPAALEAFATWVNGLAQKPANSSWSPRPLPEPHG